MCSAAASRCGGQWEGTRSADEVALHAPPRPRPPQVCKRVNATIEEGNEAAATSGSARGAASEQKSARDNPQPSPSAGAAAAGAPPKSSRGDSGGARHGRTGTGGGLAAGGAGNGSLGDLRSLVPDATAVDYDEKEDDKGDRAGPLPSGRRTGGGGAGEEGGGGGVQGVPSLGRLASAGSLFNANNGGSVPAEEAMRVDELLLLVLEAGSFFGEQVRADMQRNWWGGML